MDEVREYYCDHCKKVLQFILEKRTKYREFWKCPGCDIVIIERGYHGDKSLKK